MPPYRQPVNHYAQREESPLLSSLSGLSQLFSTITREERNRKNEEARLRFAEEASRRAEERMRIQEAQENEERGLRAALLEKQVAQETDLTTQPQVEKQVTEGVNVSPEESAFMGGMVEPGFKPQDTVTTSVPDVPRSTSVKFGGRNIDIPLLYRQDMEARKMEDFDTTLDQARTRQEALDFVDLPGVGRVNKALVPFFAAQERRDLGEKVDLGDRVARIGPDGKVIWSLGKNPAPTNTPTGEKRAWVTNTKTGQREYVTEDQRATADPGTYSDVRPPNAKVMKADPAKLRMALSALGGPGVENSLWDLATKINTDTGMMAALRGVGKRKLTELSPEMASQSKDPQIVMIGLYNTALQGFASSIAKAFGESGVLTNQDIARATGLFPRPGENPTTTEAKLKRILTVATAGMQDPAMFREIFDRDPKPAAGADGAATPGDGTPDRPIVLE